MLRVYRKRVAHVDVRLKRNKKAPVHSMDPDARQRLLMAASFRT